MDITAALEERVLQQTQETRHATGRIPVKGPANLGTPGGLVMAPANLTTPLPVSPIIDDMDTIWDQRKFSNAREPIQVQTLALRALFSRPGSPSCTDMPVKFPGSDYRLPRELAQFGEALQACMDFEHAANPRAFEKYYAYLTIDQRFVPQGKAQRGIGLHSDSVQGPRIQQKTEIEHTYLCVDRDPTLCFAQAFNLEGYDVNRHWLNAVFEKQARPDRAVSLPLYTVNLLDAYTVHTAIPASADGMRTLFRLIFSVRQFDRIGNTHNDLFDYQWNMQPRPLPQNLEFLK